MGSNRGVQVRKLFEPGKYPEALMLQHFDRHFGKPASPERVPSAESGLCALGFEPNPNHHLRLSRLQRAYVDRGWNVHFYPLAAWVEESTANFRHRRWKSPYSLSEGGARIATGTGHDASAEYSSEVRLVDIAAFVRSLPAHSVRFWKMDIEGAEWTVLPHLLKQGMLCNESVGSVAIEVHDDPEFAKSPWSDGHTVEGIRSRLHAQNNCSGAKTEFVDIDDETYGNDVGDMFSKPTLLSLVPLLFSLLLFGYACNGSVLFLRRSRRAA